MPDSQPHIPSYSAAELMRYATGHMSAAEMYTLEKAALQDAFLAEALEGYMKATAEQPAATVQVQAERLHPDAPKQSGRVIPLWKRNGLRVAVAALFIAGAGWAIFSLLQRHAQPITTVAQQAPTTLTDTGATAALATSNAAPQQSLADSDELQMGLVARNKEPDLPPGTFALKQKQQSANDFNVSAAPSPLQEAPEERKPDTTATPAASTAEVALLNKKEKMAMRSMETVPTHTFKGQVTDTKNNPVPYANVMVEGQNFGTYSDVTGRFNFISEDSVLHIRVRSVGYNNQALLLQNNHPETRIVLQEDQQLNNSLPLTVQKRNQAISPYKKSIVERDSIAGQETATLRAPFYDIYLLNNNRISPLPTLNKQVQLSFDVSKTGEATNITVIQSSGGKALDDEAIRLIKEGPKLVGDTSATSRKKVTVRF